MQTALPVVLALTYPGVSTPVGSASSFSGVFAEPNRWSVLAPMVTMFATGLINMVVVGPATTKIMKERKHQGESMIEADFKIQRRILLGLQVL